MRTSMLRVAFAAAIVAAGNVALANDSAPAEPATISATADHTLRIAIGNFTFSPATLEVPAGTTVLWVNEDDVPHTILGVDKDTPLKSPALDTDEKYSIVLGKPGTYRYFCSLHPHMTGTVVVK
ncbi:MAG: cupredoxin family copper-binding protein [Gammaproteobacteria bacterium]